MASSLRFRLLGPLGVDSEDGPVDLGPPKLRAVLAILLLHANEIVPTDCIIDLVWGESPPRTAEHSVQIYISDLRKALSNRSEVDVIETRPPGYLLNVPPDSVDALRFERLVREGLSQVRSGAIAGGRAKLEEALATWTAAPLAEFSYEDFAQGYIRSLGELRSDALEALAGVHLDQGDLDTARDRARQAIEADPLREEPRQVMMLALYRSGRQAEALRHYGDYQRLLADELGIEPSEGLRDLEERVLLQDPTLSARVPAPTGGNPYRGLRAFSEDDADVYFGRENLVAEVLEKLATDSGFVSIVGPSGSGKSSAAQAGVMPVLRAQGATVALFQPGARPLWELATALDRSGFGSRATLLRRFESDPEALVATVRRPVVLIVDQFEELFTLAEPDETARFSELVAAAINDVETPLQVVATLRADYYDRPLSIPSLAGVFSDSVVSVKPMTAHEIERAVVEPARGAGVDVEPALLAQLVADMAGEPGALPLFQFTLFELFERTSNGLTLADYEQLGGIRGALTGRADELLTELDPEGRRLVEQLMVRMVRKGRAVSTARPVPLRDLIDLGVDRVALQSVLDAFASRRLITFDRDAAGSAIVEIAHEYLITEWPQLAAWIEQHSEDLDRLHALEAAAQEWVAAGRSDDYLLRGERLKGFQEWREQTTLSLTRGEGGFLDASVDLRSREQAAQAEHAAKERALARSARRRLWAFGTAVAALAAAVTLLVVTLIPERPPDVIYWGAPADSAFGGLILSGLETAVEQHGATGEHFLEDPALVRTVADRVSRGTGLVLLGGLLAEEEAAHRLIAEHPETTFVWVDCVEALIPEEGLGPNEVCITSAHEEMGFLAGVVAAHKTEAGHVGIVVGMDDPFMHPFHQGFEQGVAYVDPNIATDHVYLSPFPDGFGSATLGWLAARVLIDEGADVVFQAAGDSGNGVFWAVHDEAVRSGRTLWAIGVDVDEHEKFEEWKSEPWASGIPLSGWQEHTLTSIVKRLDVAVFEAIDNYFTTGEVAEVELSIANGGIDYVTTGGLIDDVLLMLEAAKEDVTGGSVEVVVYRADGVRHLMDLLFP